MNKVIIIIIIIIIIKSNITEFASSLSCFHSLDGRFVLLRADVKDNLFVFLDKIFLLIQRNLLCLERNLLFFLSLT